ncbi:unnamed protein product [marine sediment metagenome]|uniref:HPr domain-containing protein n=1 Tax=marine sediment metagenome TaxID=412755 RepID=X1E1P4_9ZZZZ
MKIFKINIQNSEGLHARPASRLVELCHRFDSSIILSSQETEADGKNITEVLGLGAEMGRTLTIRITGKDETETEKAIKDFFSGGLKHAPV